MPIYDYRCRACGAEFDALVKLGETPDCLSCHGNDLERLRSLPPAVSTDKSRKRNAAIARRRANSVRRDQKHAEAEYQRKYLEEHRGE